MFHFQQIYTGIKIENYNKTYTSLLVVYSLCVKDSIAIHLTGTGPCNRLYYQVPLYISEITVFLI